LWVCVGFCGYVWLFVGVCGFLWVCVVFCGCVWVGVCLPEVGCLITVCAAGESHAGYCGERSTDATQALIQEPVPVLTQR
jgi:hypothetical protein